MKVSSVNYSYNQNNNSKINTYNKSRSQQPAFKSFYDDDELFLGSTSNGYSILDLFKKWRKPKITKEDEEKVLETWDPDLGDISDIINPKNNNFGDLEEALREYEEGKLDKKPPQKQEEEPPSIFNY